MAEFVTKKENTRRMMTLITCIIICTFSIVGGIYAIKGAGDIEDKEKSDTTLKKLRTAIEQVRTERRNTMATYEEFSKAIGWRTLSRNSQDRFVTTGVSGAEMKSYLDFWVKELARPGYDIKDFKPWLQEGQGNTLALTTLFDKLKEKEEYYRAENAKLDARQKQVDQEAKATIEDINNTEARNLQEIDSQLKTDYMRLLKDLGTRERQHADELAALEVETFTKQRELTELKNKNLKEATKLEDRRSDLVTRINWIQFHREEAKERKEPDGEILGIDEKYNVAYIDLLHADRIFPGTRFRVYSLEKGGVKVDKGEVEVTKVRDAMSSIVAVVRTIDANDPIKRGDKIYNEFYEKGKVRYIALSGRLTGKLSNEEAARKIREFGDIFQEKVDERTNYLVVGENFAGPDNQIGTDDDEANFKLAQEWGVKILLERYLYEYLGVP
jgi:hypothetical protein